MAVPHRACLGASRQIHDANNVALPDVVRWVGAIQKYRFVTIDSANSNSLHVALLSRYTVWPSTRHYWHAPSITKLGARPVLNCSR
jgi:hypothetical protein